MYTVSDSHSDSCIGARWFCHICVQILNKSYKFYLFTRDRASRGPSGLSTTVLSISPGPRSEPLTEQIDFWNLLTLDTRNTP